MSDHQFLFEFSNHECLHTSVFQIEIQIPNTYFLTWWIYTFTFVQLFSSYKQSSEKWPQEGTITLPNIKNCLGEWKFKSVALVIDASSLWNSSWSEGSHTNLSESRSRIASSRRTANRAVFHLSMLFKPEIAGYSALKHMTYSLTPQD